MCSAVNRIRHKSFVVAAGNDQHNLCMGTSKKTTEAVEAGRRIRITRDAIGISLAELSRRINGLMTGQRISNYEQGLRELDIWAANVLSRPLDVHPAYLMGLLTEDEHDFLKALRAQKKPKRPERPLHIVPAPPGVPNRKRP